MLSLYPWICRPLYEETAAPGELLPELGRAERPVGCGISYELIDDGDTQTVVDNGSLAGRSLRSLIQEDASRIVGRRHHGGSPMPVRAYFTDTAARLPLQVHPDGARGKPGKYVGFYLVAAGERADVRAGVSDRMTRQQFLQKLQDADFESLVQEYAAAPGDAYLIPPGRIYAIGAPILALVVETNVDTAYTLTDWQQPVPEAELQEALAHTLFHDRGTPRIRGEANMAALNRKVPVVNQCPQFQIEELRLVQEMRDVTRGACQLLVALDGDMAVGHGEDDLLLPRGRSCLLPAALGMFRLTPMAGLTRVLRIFPRIG